MHTESLDTMRLRSTLNQWLQLHSLWLGIAILATLLVAYGSLMPARGTAALPHIDKVVHFTAYCGLAGLFTIALPRAPRFWVCGTLICVGAALELLQYFMKLGRSGSWLDLVANSTGAILGTYLAVMVLRALSER